MTSVVGLARERLRTGALTGGAGARTTRSSVLAARSTDHAPIVIAPRTARSHGDPWRRPMPRRRQVDRWATS